MEDACKDEVHQTHLIDYMMTNTQRKKAHFVEYWMLLLYRGVGGCRVGDTGVGILT